MGKVGNAVLVLALAAAALGAGLYYFYPKNLARRPPELDALRTDTLKQTHVEADFLVETDFLGEPNLEGNVQVVFQYVPPQADKAELDRVVRELVKAHLPKAKEIDVRFGDNLRTKPLEVPEEEGPMFGPKKKKSKKTSLNP